MHTVTERDQKTLQELQAKIEQTIPSNMKVRYNISVDQLTVSLKVKNATDAIRQSPRLTEYVRGAALAVNLNL